MNKFDYKVKAKEQLGNVGFSDDEINFIFNTEYLNKQLMQFYKQGGEIKKGLY